jgi:hypothetical protein
MLRNKGNSMSQDNRKPPSRKLQVGDRVGLRLGVSDVSARIVEDRGHIGVNGRQLIRVELEGPPNEDRLEFELPAEEVIQL